MLKLWDYICPAGHVTEQLVDSKQDETSFCNECGQVARRQIGGIGRQLFFEEGRGRWDHHLSHKPVYITSERQHQKLMKEAGVTLAGEHRGHKGQWV